MPQIENVVSQVTARALNHENSNPNGEALTIHNEKDRVRGQEELPTPQRQRIDDEPVEMPQMDNASAKQLKDSVEKLEALLRRTQNDDVRADCKETIAFFKDKIAAMIVQEALQALEESEIVTARIADKSWKSERPLLLDPVRLFSPAKAEFAASPVVQKPFDQPIAAEQVAATEVRQGEIVTARIAAAPVDSTFDQPIATEQVAAKEALQGEIVTARIAAAPVDSRTNQAGVAVAASKSTKQPVPANFNPATCPCPGKNKHPRANFRSQKHELWMAMNAAAAVGIDQPIAAVNPHLQM